MSADFEETSYSTWERCIIFRHDTVIKRTLCEDELVRNVDGILLRPIWSRERLQNEAATLQYVAKKTDIPVPESRVYTKDGLTYLETSRITDGVPLSEISQSEREAAVREVDKQMNTSILPQLHSLRRDCIGSVDADLPVFPPQRVYNRDRRSWTRVRSGADPFVLCHNDLGPQNILVNPSTYRIVGIIDWEFAGFFPAHFELPLWTIFDWNLQQEVCESTISRELGFFGIERADLRDCITEHEPKN